MINDEVQVMEVRGVKDYINKGYTLMYGVTKNDRTCLIMMKDKVSLVYDVNAQQFIFTGLKRKK